MAKIKTKTTINVNGKDYIVHGPRVGRIGGTWDDTTEDYVGIRTAVTFAYWSTRNGDYFGPSRWTDGRGKGVGAKLYAAAVAHFGVDVDQMIADYDKAHAS